ncbi:MOSC domain-containing protein [Marinobacter fonticola]|uniref:MOSC domain-containing protein n=1 Tax=Marinobacter fonticola TaxID=2603215 RepID=UPI0011E6A1B1|nr:MOSC N-terminal beta barrel domain-containing protein [Marinobacter fonticola]
MAQLKIEQLFFYPVKSLHGVALDAMTLDAFGPAGDRRWMIVDDEGRFVTQREQPRLAQVNATLTPSGLHISIPGEAPEKVVASDETRRVLVWRDWVKAQPAQPGPSEKLSAWLGKAVQFVYMPESTLRPVDNTYVDDERRVSFADGFPFLITHTMSLESLSSRIGEPVDMRRFRPNIVVSGGEAFEEDRWAALSLGSLRFRLVKPCTRCVMTTVHPDEGVRSDNLQPLRELGRFRRTPDGVVFGVNAVHDALGELRVGDYFDVDYVEDH